MSTFRIEASAHNLIGVNTGAFMLGTVVLVFISFFRLLVSPLAIGLLIAALAFCLGGEIAAWHLRGIRLITLDSAAITLEIGNNRAVRRIKKIELKNIRIRRFLVERWVVIDLRAAAGSRSLFARLGHGPRIKIRGNAFRSAEFEKFLEEISRWRLVSLDSDSAR